MDPLSEVLALIKSRSLVSGGYSVSGDVAVGFPRHTGIKCYAMIAGQCWLRVEGVAEPLQITAGDCWLLPRGLPFSISTDLSLTPVDFTIVQAQGRFISAPLSQNGSGCYLAGGHFSLDGAPARMLLDSLPPIVHIQTEADKAAMRWSLDRMAAELREPQPGGSLIAQQLAYMMLIQALRLHLSDPANGAGWLFALSDPHMAAAITAMHDAPGQPWTLQQLAARVGMSRSVFAERFKATVGATPMEYLTRWRMLRAGERLRHSADSLAQIAGSLGYDSESAFGKAFRRVMQCSPRQFRRSDTADPVPAAAPLPGVAALPAHAEARPN